MLIAQHNSATTIPVTRLALQQVNVLRTRNWHCNTAWFELGARVAAAHGGSCCQP